MRTISLLYVIFAIVAIAIGPVHAALPTYLSIAGSQLGVEDPRGPLMVGVLSTTTGFPLSSRIILFEASKNGEFFGDSITAVVGKAVTNRDGEFRFRPSSFSQGPYFRAMFAGEGDYEGTRSEIINLSTLLEEAKDARVQDGPGNLYVSTTPSNADVYLNDKLVGKTDSTIRGIPAGEYDVTFVLNGYANATYSVLITPKKTVSIVVPLQRPMGAFTNPFDEYVAAMKDMELVADIHSGPASFQLRQNTSDPASIPHNVDVIQFSDPRDTSYLVIVSPDWNAVER